MVKTALPSKLLMIHDHLDSKKNVTVLIVERLFEHAFGFRHRSQCEACSHIDHHEACCKGSHQKYRFAEL